jgi:RimJ/RimL family protein N-acetyltransferase
MNQVHVLQRRSVISLWDALIVRRLRNTCCDYMTNYQQKLGLWQQVRWYYRNYQPASRSGDYRIFLFADEAGRAVGYGALQLHDNELYITECLATDARGRGYGKQILASLVQIGLREGRALVAEIWATNQASRALHEKAGFLLTEHRDHKGRELLVYKLDTQP